MSLLLVFLLVIVAVLLGSLLFAVLGSETLGLAFEFAAGLVIMHVLLLLLNLLAIPWKPGMLVPLLVVGACWGLRERNKRPKNACSTSPFGLGDGVAFTTLVVLGLFAALRMIANPDFIYHWGPKAQRFALAEGLDVAWLQNPWNYYVHPDYPNLVPDLMALLTILAGTFREEVCLLFSVAVMGAILLASRKLLGRTQVLPSTLQGGMALISCSLLGFSVSWQMTGNADSLICLAVLLGVFSLGGRLDQASDVGIGVAAALAAACKIEGVVFAGILLAVHIIRRAGDRSLTPRVLLRASWLPAVVLAPWAIQVERYGLMQGYYTGAFEFDRLSLAIRSAITISLNDGWHGVSLVALLLVPWLFAAGGWARRGASVFGIMFGFYFLVYSTAPADTEMLVRSSFPRLMMHLVPTIFVLALWRLESVSQVSEKPEGALSR